MEGLCVACSAGEGLPQGEWIGLSRGYEGGTEQGVCALPIQAAKDYRTDADLHAACEPDVKQLCADVNPGEGRIQDCLRDKAVSVSWECQEELFRQVTTLVTLTCVSIARSNFYKLTTRDPCLATAAVLSHLYSSPHVLLPVHVQCCNRA